jgi:hypothetical protein
MISGTILLPFLIIPNLGTSGTIIFISITNLLLLFFYLLGNKKNILLPLVIFYIFITYLIYINASNLRDLYSFLYLRGIN